METTTFVVACKGFFGLLPGQSLQEFKAELDKLTAQDRQDLIEMFPSVGYTIK